MKKLTFEIVVFTRVKWSKIPRNTKLVFHNFN